MEITQEIAKEKYDYDPETGSLTFAKNISNCKKSAEVGHLDKEGYVSTKVNGSRRYVHRIIWLWMTGEWPVNEIDHRDRGRDNNRWLNLRDVTRIENHDNNSIYGTSPYPSFQTGKK